MTDNATAEAEATGVAAETGETGAAEETPAALLTAEQVARALGISTRRLRDWRKEGRLTEVGRFKRGTARIPLFDPADVIRLQREQVTEEAPAATVATVADHAAFAETVARQVRLLVAERAEAEAAAVAPLVALVRDQQETIDELRRRAEVAEAERDRLAAARAAQDAPGAPKGVSADDPSPEPSAGLWARVRRWWRG